MTLALKIRHRHFANNYFLINQIKSDESNQRDSTNHRLVIDRLPSNFVRNKNCLAQNISMFLEDKDFNLFTWSLDSMYSTEIHVFLNFSVSLTFHFCTFFAFIETLIKFSCHGRISNWIYIDANPKVGKIVYFDVMKYDENTDQV